MAKTPRPVHGRIPNFVGAEKAAAVLAASEPWKKAHVLKCNPDSAQQPVREIALREGKTLYMAVPKLKSPEPFIRIRGGDVSKPQYASTIRGGAAFGTPVSMEEVEKVDLVVAGCVAVNAHGARLGKGGGFSDLEFALTRAYGVVSKLTPVVTTVHSCQVLDEEIPMARQDEPVDYIATPERLIETGGRFPKPAGIHWDLLTERQILAIPILRQLREQARATAAG